MRNLFLLITIAALLSSCASNIPPTVEITSPNNGDVIEQGTTVSISATAEDEDDNLSEAKLSIDDNDVSTSNTTSVSHSWNTTGVATGGHTIMATATDEEGEQGADNIAITIIAAPIDTLYAPVADFIASQNFLNEGGLVTFTDQSTHEPTSWSWTFTGGTP